MKLRHYWYRFWNAIFNFFAPVEQVIVITEESVVFKNRAGEVTNNSKTHVTVSRTGNGILVRQNDKDLYDGPVESMPPHLQPLVAQADETIVSVNETIDRFNEELKSTFGGFQKFRGFNFKKDSDGKKS
jgi:hypothetical protein